MIVELRQYTLLPGMTEAFLDLYRSEGLATQKLHLGPPIGYFTSEVGPLNRVVHLWGFESHADRERKRRAMDGDPAWQAYRRKLFESGFLQDQTTMLLRSTEFSPL